MDRQSSRPARGTLMGLAAAAIALATACTPNQGVKPGAPVLTEVLIIENGVAIHSSSHYEIDYKNIQAVLRN